MDKTITEDQIKQIAESFSLTYAHLKALLLVETSGKGFDKLGNLFIQFEPHVFASWLDKFDIEHDYSKKKDDRGRTTYYISAKGINITNGVEVQSAELKAYSLACQISEGAAMLSTSWGLGQVMGYNFALAGYHTAREMIKAYEEAEYFQVQGMANFCKNKGIIQYLRAEDWHMVATLYNGAGYINQKDLSRRYDIRLKEEYEKLKK